MFTWKTGVSINLYAFLIALVIRNSSISDVENDSIRIIKECNFIEKSKSKNVLNHTVDNCNFNEIYAYPNRFILFFFSSYLHHFINKSKSLFVSSEMVQLHGSNISLDHKFKVSSSHEYDTLFLLLKNSGQVLAWQLTWGTSFKQVFPLLKNIY